MVYDKKAGGARTSASKGGKVPQKDKPTHQRNANQRKYKSPKKK